MAPLVLKLVRPILCKIPRQSRPPLDSSQKNPAQPAGFLRQATDTNAATARRTLAMSSFGIGVPRARREAGVERFTPDTLAGLEILTMGKSLVCIRVTVDSAHRHAPACWRIRISHAHAG